MEERAKALLKQAHYLFEKKKGVNALQQEIAEHFYPERAFFTADGALGDQFADGLMTSYPVLARRELGSAFSGMLRPANKQWAKLHMEGANTAEKRWLEMAADRQRKIMYDRRSCFVRATKEGDHDFAAFGQCAISVELNKDRDGVLYRSWHLRDCAWAESYDGSVNTFFRKWKPTATQLAQLFTKTVSRKVTEKLKDSPYCEINCMHVVLPAEQYQDGKAWRTQWVSVHIDVDNCTIMEEVGVHQFIYVVPRWQTVSGSQYAFSPATICALPDARLIQAMTRVLLEAGEKAVDPPMIAVQEAVRSDINIFAGGVTWVDQAYDERLGEVLRPLSHDKSGIPLGMDMRDDTRRMIADAFYLNKLNLPPQGDMTAFEVSQRIQEYIRQALPLFEPMEAEYNGALCDATFDLLIRNGAFGSIKDMPRSLLGKDFQFRFESPLQEAIEREKSQRFTEAFNLVGIAAQLDPSVAINLDVKTAFRDVLSSIGAPSKWIRDEKEAEAIAAQQEEDKQAQMAMMAAAQGAQTIEAMGKAGKAVNEAQPDQAA
jgi:hypothetical protein